MALKRYGVLLGTFLTSLVHLNAQSLDFYPIFQTTEAWTPLSSDSVVLNQNFDDHVVGPISIPNITFGEVVYDQVYISSNGFITLGQAPSTNEYSPIANGLSAPVIAPFAGNLAGTSLANSKVSYVLSSSLQSNLKIQWSNVHRVGYPNELFSFEVNIDFGTWWNHIHFKYGDFQNIQPTSTAIQVGLRVGSGDVSNLVSNRETNPIHGWAPDSTASSSFSYMQFPAINTTNPTPPNGLKYSWFQSSPVNNNPTQFCDVNGNLVVYSNYDGGVLNINCDVDIPDLKIGVCTYEPVQVNIGGPYASNVTQVLYSGFNSSQGHIHCGTLTPATTSINGVSSSISQVLTMPSIGSYLPSHTFGQAYLSGIMVGASGQCDTLYPHGGGNTADEIVGHFLHSLGGTLRFHHTQYGCWLGEPRNLSDGGTCCLGGQAAPDSVLSLNGSGQGNSPTSTVSNARRTISATPNPASDYVDVQMSDKGLKVVRFTNVLGRLEWVTTTTDQSVTIPVNSLPSGLYLVEVQSEEGRARQYVIKR
jgi:hypothetical protein